MIQDTVNSQTIDIRFVVDLHILKHHLRWVMR